MSADRWSVCPACTADSQKKLAEMRKTHAESYGKVAKPMYDEQATRIKELEDLISGEDEGTNTQLREDWEVVRNGAELKFNYRCSCYKCGRNYEIEHTWTAGELNVLMGTNPKHDTTPYETRASKALSARRTNGR